MYGRSMPAKRGIAFVLTLALAGCGGDDDSDAPERAATPAKPAITPFPSIDMADLEPGIEYTTQKFRPAISFTLPEGTEWKAWSADKPDHVEIEPEVTDPVDDSGFGFHHFTQVFPPDEGGEIPGDAVPGPDDFAQWLTTHPHLKTTKPKPVEALGLKGVSIDVTVKSSQPKKYRDCGKVEGDCVVMFIGGIEPYVYGSQTKARFYVLEQPDGKELIVESWVEPLKAFDEQMKVFDEALATAKVVG